MYPLQSLPRGDITDDKEVEKQLVALRSHLLALGKTENDLQNLRQKSSDLSPVNRSDPSILEILQLWQRVFRETFQQYHRLSSQLVRGEDGAAALRLWEEYLGHVQAFLATSIPEDYHSLSEHRHICEVHENLLASQRKVLLSKSDPNGFLGSGIVDDSVLQQFVQLTNLHNETLARIMDRHAEVEERLNSWDRYRIAQNKLLAWLKDAEKERSKLQLRYVHIRRVPKVMQRIQHLIAKIPQGEEQSENLRKQQETLLPYCDEALATSVRMEHAAITQRLSNLRAALETWKDFLQRVIDLGQSYETQVKSLQEPFQEIQHIIDSSSSPSSNTGMRNCLDNLRLQRTRLVDLTPKLEDLGVTQEQLKECVSPADMKTINQMVWILWQQHGDLDHQLAMQCHRLEERLGLGEMFANRKDRLVTWIGDVDRRLTHRNEAIRDPEEVLRRLETELISEIALKEREKDWVLNAGTDLVLACGDAESEKDQKKQVQDQVDDVRRRWDQLNHSVQTRKSKLNDIMQTMAQLEIRISQIRAWLFQIETQLSAPLVIESCTKSAIDEKLKEQDGIQKSLELESGNVGEVLNLCELLVADTDAWKAHFDTTGILTAMDSLERRWKNVCGQTAERKRRILNIWKLLQEVLKLSTEHEPWLKEKENVLLVVDKSIPKLNQEQLQQSIYEIEKLVSDVESHNPALQILEHSYSKLYKASGIEPENLQKLIAPARSMLTRWYALIPTANDILDKLNRELTAYRDFVTAHGKAVVQLTRVDGKLTQLQHLSAPEASPASRMREIESLENSLKDVGEILKEADELGLLVMKKCAGKTADITSIQEMIDEYQHLWADIDGRLRELKEQTVVPQEVDESVQVETLKFERDSAVQVNTLQSPLIRMTSITAKDAYMYELDAAIKESIGHLDNLDELVSMAEPTEGNSELATIAMKLSKIIAACKSSIELVKHLSELLISESGASEEEARSKDVKEIVERYERLLELARDREQQIKNLRYVLFMFKFY